MILSPIAKAVVAFLVTGINFANGLITDGDWTGPDSANLAAWILSTLAVYLVPNKPAPSYRGSLGSE